MATMAASPKNVSLNGSANQSSFDKASEKMQHMKEEMYSTFSDALEKTKAEVRDLQGKLKEYDDKFQASATVQRTGQRATDFFKQSLEEIKTTLDDLSEKAKAVFLSVKENALEALEAVIKKLKETMEKLKSLVIEYDQKFGVSQKISDIVTPVINIAQQNIELLKNKALEVGKSGRSFIINTAAKVETKFSIESKLSDLDQKYKFVEKAKQLQEKGEEFIEKQQLKEKVKELDEKLTGSKVGTYLEEGVNFATKEWEKIHQEYEIARENSRENLQEAAKGK